MGIVNEFENHFGLVPGWELMDQPSLVISELNVAKDHTFRLVRESQKIQNSPYADEETKHQARLNAARAATVLLKYTSAQEIIAVNPNDHRRAWSSVNPI